MTACRAGLSLLPFTVQFGTKNKEPRHLIMATATPFGDHTIHLERLLISAYQVEVTKDGHIRPVPDAKDWLDEDVQDVWLHCHECGKLEGSLREAHGIKAEWDEVPRPDPSD